MDSTSSIFYKHQLLLHSALLPSWSGPCCVVSPCPPGVMGEHWVLFWPPCVSLCSALMAKSLPPHAFVGAVPETLHQTLFLSLQVFYVSLLPELLQPICALRVALL